MHRHAPALALLLVLGPACAQPARPVQVAADAAEARDRIADLADHIERSLPDWGVPGLSVAVVFDDETVFAQGFGVKELGRPDRIDAETLFQIGSVSKSFAAAAIGALVDDGIAAWDDPVIRHLPWFRVQDTSATRNMTLRDLLSHQSGIPEDAYPVLAVMDARAAAERVRLLDNQAPLRQGHRYSNQGYGVAGVVVEEVTGMSWGEWLRERIFGPLGMETSGASPYEVWDEPFVAPAFLGGAPGRSPPGIADAPERNVAMPHGVARDGSRRVLAWQSYDSMQGAGSVVSSATEMAQWLRMHLGRGAVDGRTVLEEATVDEMHAPQVASEGAGIFTDGPDQYGLGWSLTTFQGRRQVSHGGGIFGFPAYAAMLPEVGAGVVVLANGSLWTPYYPHQEIVAWVFARLTGGEERDWHGESMARTRAIEQQAEAALAARDADRIPGTAPSLPLDRYAGAYQHEKEGTAHVELVRNDANAAEPGLRIHFGAPGSFSGSMEHWHNDTFHLFFDGGDGQAYSSSFVTFTTGPAGEVAMDMGFMGRYQRLP